MTYPHLTKAGISESLQEKLALYEKELLAWNEVMNLTRITDPEEIEIKHFLDSLSLLELPECQRAKTILDVGTGAGFPGMVLALALPKAQVTLLDSLGKRIRFLTSLGETLGVDVEAIHGRAEELARKDMRESFDVVTSRAVASLPTLCEYTLPFVEVGGTFVAMKGANTEEELKESTRAIATLGGRLNRVEQVRLPGAEEHHLVVIEKVSPTPKAYPRGGGKPRKAPL